MMFEPIRKKKVVHSIGRVFCVLLYVLVFANSPMFNGSASAAEIDLKDTGCPELPQMDRGLGFSIVINEDGTTKECSIGNSLRCARIFNVNKGFLCISFEPTARPTITQIEGPSSQRVVSVIVDGVEHKEGAFGYPHLHLRDVIGTGASGRDYDVVVVTSVGQREFTTTLNVTGIPGTSIQINSIVISYPD